MIAWASVVAGLLVGAPEPAMVAVGAGPHDQRLSGALALRLAADGYCVVGAGATAPATIHVETSSRAATVEVRGARSVRRDVALSGAPVDALEIQHWALIALEEAGTSGVGAARRDGARLESLDAGIVAGRLPVESLAAGLLRAGVALGACSRSAPRQLCFRQVETQVEVLAPPSGDCEETVEPARTIRRADGDDDEQFAARVVSEVVTLLTPARSAIVPAPVVARRAEETPARSIRLALSGGVLASGGAKSAVAFLGDLDLRSPLRVTLLAAISPSTAGGEGSVFEGFVAIGPSAALDLDVVRLSAGALGGARLHRFAIDGADQGVRGDWVVLALGRAEIPLALGLELDLQILGGLSGRGRTHRLAGQEIWRSDPGLLVVLAGLGYRWSI